MNKIIKEFRKDFNIYCEELKDKFNIRIPLKFRDDIWDWFISKALEKQKEEIFNSKKGDTVNVIKKDGTEQIWRCVKINKLN